MSSPYLLKSKGMGVIKPMDNPQTFIAFKLFLEFELVFFFESILTNTDFDLMANQAVPRVSFTCTNLTVPNKFI